MLKCNVMWRSWFSWCAHTLFYIRCYFHIKSAALTLSSSVSLVACMSRVSSSDILSAVWFWISSSRALSFGTHKIYINIRTSLKLLMETPPFFFSCRWPVRCGPVGRPHDPASPLCSQHPPAGHQHPTHCRGTPGSGPEASRSLLPLESKIQKT